MKISFLSWTGRAAVELVDLRGANLRSADLQNANLQSADLQDANLQSADLQGADLRGANLRGADLQSANLQNANLQGANLQSVNLRSANLQGANLQDTKGLAQFTVVNPSGDVVGWKKTKEGNILRLRIPYDAKRVNAYGSRKCRAEFAYVEWESAPGPHHSAHDSTFTYSIGLVRPNAYDPDPRIECSSGIHFFITREEAEEYS